MDIGQIQTLIGLATGAVGLTGQAAATAESVRKIFTRTDPGRSDDSEEQKLLNSLASQLTSANMMNLQLSSVLKDIASRIEIENKFDRQMQRYRLIKTDLGFMLYVLKDEYVSEEPIHYLCPVCAQKERVFSFVVGGRYNKQCQTCKNRFSFENEPPTQRRNRGGFV